MNIEYFRNYCLTKPGVTEDFPFDEQTLVFKVMGKMFAATNIHELPFTVNLKCDPEYALDLRASYDQIIPGFHMSKKHWNTVDFDGGLPGSFLKELIDQSYDLVVAGLTKKVRAELEIIKRNEQ